MRYFTGVSEAFMSLSEEGMALVAGSGDGLDYPSILLLVYANDTRE